jgi:hypothetical protein
VQQCVDKLGVLGQSGGQYAVQNLQDNAQEVGVNPELGSMEIGVSSSLTLPHQPAVPAKPKIVHIRACLHREQRRRGRERHRKRGGERERGRERERERDREREREREREIYIDIYIYIYTGSDQLWLIRYSHPNLTTSFLLPHKVTPAYELGCVEGWISSGLPLPLDLPNLQSRKMC